MNENANQINRIAKLFDSLSDSYDSVGVDFFQPIASGLVQALKPSLGESWLDIGCGRGAIAESAATILGSSGKLVGFDISARMIENAQAMADRKNLKNVDFIVDDAQSPEKIDGEFDVISSCLVLFFLPDPLSALQNWRPFLKGSGRIGVTTFGKNDSRWMEIDQLFETYLPPKTLDARTTGVQGSFSSDLGMESLLLAAGYHDVSTVTNLLPVKFKTIEKWYEFSWSTGQRSAWLQVPEEERPALRAKAEEYLLDYLEDDGSVVFHQEIRHTLAKK